MKFEEIKNVTDGIVVVSQVRGFRVNPGETIIVHPATAAHPAVRRLMPPQGSSLELVTQGITEAVEPIAPAIPRESAPEVVEVVDPPVVAMEEVPEEVAPVTVEAQPAPAVEEEISPATTDTATEEEVETVSPAEEPAPETAGKTLRDVFTEVPGVTETNIDLLLEAFDSVESLANSTKDALVDLGLSASASKKILSWAKTQLS
jgi:hypothetical protein